MDAATLNGHLQKHLRTATFPVTVLPWLLPTVRV